MRNRTILPVPVAYQFIPRGQLTSQGLAAALSGALGDTALRSRAAEFGVRIRAENGVAAADLQFDRIGRQDTGSPI